MYKSKGFTLIEVMVVVVIMSIMVGTVMLTFPDRNKDLLKEDAERFTTLVSLAQDEAILQSRDLAIAINEDGYEFFSRENTSWLPFAEEPFSPRLLSGLVTSELYLEGVDVKLQSQQKTKPQIVIYSSGEITPFSYSFGYKGKSNVTLTFDGGGDAKQEYKFEEE